MNRRMSALIIVFAMIVSSGFAQEKSKNETKEGQKSEDQSNMEQMLNARDFLFTAQMMMPQGYRSVNLTTNSYNVKFHPDLIVSNLPYMGKATGNIGYGGESAMQFEGEPQEYNVSRGKKNFQVKCNVRANNDTYRLMLTVSLNGTASLSIMSNNRSSVSYSGNITAPPEPAENK